MTIRRLAHVYVGLVVLFSVTLGSSSASSTRATLTATKTMVSAECVETPIRSGPLPWMALPAGIPWMRARPASTKVAAVLFFSYRNADGTYEELHTGGVMPNGRTTKVLWSIHNSRAGSWVHIHGKNLTGTGTLSLGARGSGGIASIIDVPTPGCWQFTVKSGRVRGKVVMRVVS